MTIRQFLHRNQKLIRKVVLAIGVSLYLLYIIDPPGLSIEATIALHFAIIAYILDSIADKVAEPPTIKIYKKAQDAVPDLLEYIKKTSIKNAWLIQYSGRKVDDILANLFFRGVSITMWLKNPKNAISAEQTERIEVSIRQMPTELSRSDEKTSQHIGELTIYTYDVPGALRGMLLDDKLLVIGFYTYEHILVPNPDYPVDEFEISGHDRPCIVIHKGHPDFEILMEEFEHQLENFRKFNEEHALKIPNDTQSQSSHNRVQGSSFAIQKRLLIILKGLFFLNR